MFYCNKCAKKMRWSETTGQSYRPCQICGETTMCNDYPSKALPKPERTRTRIPQGTRPPKIETPKNKYTRKKKHKKRLW